MWKKGRALFKDLDCNILNVQVLFMIMIIIVIILILRTL